MLDIEYEDCGNACPEDESIKPGSFCEDCPVKEARENFKSFSEGALEANPHCKGKWQRFGFESLKKTVEEVSDLEDLPRERRSIKTHRLIEAFQSARRRFEKIQSQNSKQTE